MTSERDVRLLPRFLALLASDKPGEAMEALRRVNAILRDRGTSLDAVVLANAPAPSRPAAAEPPPHSLHLASSPDDFARLGMLQAALELNHSNAYLDMALDRVRGSVAASPARVALADVPLLVFFLAEAVCAMQQEGQRHARAAQAAANEAYQAKALCRESLAHREQLTRQLASVRAELRAARGDPDVSQPSQAAASGITAETLVALYNQIRNTGEVSPPFAEFLAAEMARRQSARYVPPYGAKGQAETTGGA